MRPSGVVPEWSCRLPSNDGWMTMAASSDEQIRARAHQLWEAAGSPEGREHEFWYQAEKELRGDAGNNPDEKSSTFVE
jgi:hypothetical protein